MINVQNAYKSFNNITILNNVSVSFTSGKINLIIGQSGSGKTVLVKSMIGLLDLDMGSVFYKETDFYKCSSSQKESIRKRIGMLFQGAALFDSLNVEENIRFPLDMHTNQSNEEKKETVNRVIERVGLKNSNNKLPSELSGGMKKRVGIARAIVLNPAYLFCDEPTSGLDPKTAVIIDKLIQEITHEYNITTIVNTHDLNTVSEIGEKIVFINKGKNWWEGTRETVFNNDNKELNEFIFSSSLAKRTKSN